ncbi:MAG: DUF4097 family beta strand repeat-containing protein [Candidatus Izemoplasmatales bacterium]|nr:DUF4097 family beta strand repeat-containing protein [Candidatus Izemoplasmatales bacterium]
MKNLFKIGLAIFIIGIGLVIIFGLVSGEGFSSISPQDTDYTYHEVTYSEDEFTSMAFTLENKKVTVLPSEDENIKICYYESKHDAITIENDGTTLSILNETEWYFHFFTLNIFSSPVIYQVYIYLPDTFAVDLLVNTDNGAIYVSDHSLFTSLNLESSNGEIHLDNIDTTASIRLDTSNGGLYINNVSTTSSITLDTSNGKVAVDELTALRVDISTSNGNIDCNNITTDNLNVYTSNGSIDIDFQGAFTDYYLKMSTTNGSYYLNGDKVTQNAYHDSLLQKIDCRTSNGNIHINFSS